MSCRLCENACPYGAIHHPTKDLPSTEIDKNKRRFIVFAALLPILTAAGGWLGKTVYPLLAQATGMEDSVQPLGMKLTVAAGMLMGIVIAFKLVQTVIFRRRKDYEINHADCMACGRCFDYCPIEIKKRETVADGVH